MYISGSFCLFPLSSAAWIRPSQLLQPSTLNHPLLYHWVWNRTQTVPNLLSVVVRVLIYAYGRRNISYFSDNSDFLTIHNAFSSWRRACSNAGFARKFCRANFMSHQVGHAFIQCYQICKQYSRIYSKSRIFVNNS